MKTAILFAAGKGTRLEPITYKYAKCMLKINGTSILQHNVEILQDRGFSVIVLTGHAFSSIDILPEVKYYWYPDFATTNSAMTLKANLAYLEPGTLLMNADCYLLSTDFDKHFVPNATTLLCQPLTAPGWSYKVENDLLAGVNYRATQGFGDGMIYCDNEEDICKVKNYINQLSSEAFWENSFVDLYKSLNIYVKKLQSFYIEFDTVQEVIDSGMSMPLTIAKQIADFAEADKIELLKGGLTNHNFVARVNGTRRVVRIPGRGTDKFIDRKAEKSITDIAVKLGLTPSTVCYESGIKLSDFLGQCKPVVNWSALCLKQLKNLLDKLHQSASNLNLPDTTIFDELEKYRKLSENVEVIELDKEDLQLVDKLVDEFDSLPKVLCHRDLVKENILVSRDRSTMLLIDFEYAGLAPSEWEYGNFILLQRWDKAYADELAFEKFVITVADLTQIDRQMLYKGALLASLLWLYWSIFMKIDSNKKFYFNQLQFFKGLINE